MNRSAFSPVSPKFLFYRTGGSGRDTYISHDNGGILKTSSQVSRPLRGKNLVSEPIRTRQTPKSLHYHCNGSGRDIYINHDDGGLHSPPNRGNLDSSFCNSLRRYSPDLQASSLNKTDYFSWAQTNWVPVTNRRVLGQKSRDVRNLVTRLADRSFSRKKVNDTLV